MNASGPETQTPECLSRFHSCCSEDYCPNRGTPSKPDQFWSLATTASSFPPGPSMVSRPQLSFSYDDLTVKFLCRRWLGLLPIIRFNGITGMIVMESCRIKVLLIIIRFNIHFPIQNKQTTAQCYPSPKLGIWVSIHVQLSPLGSLLLMTALEPCIDTISTISSLLKTSQTCNKTKLVWWRRAIACDWSSVLRRYGFWKVITMQNGNEGLRS